MTDYLSTAELTGLKEAILSAIDKSISEEIANKKIFTQEDLKQCVVKAAKTFEPLSDIKKSLSDLENHFLFFKEPSIKSIVFHADIHLSEKDFELFSNLMNLIKTSFYPFPKELKAYQFLSSPEATYLQHDESKIAFFKTKIDPILKSTFSKFKTKEVNESMQLDYTLVKGFDYGTADKLVNKAINKNVNYFLLGCICAKLSCISKSGKEYSSNFYAKHTDQFITFKACLNPEIQSLEEKKVIECELDESKIKLTKKQKFL